MPTSDFLLENEFWQKKSEFSA